MKNIMFSKFFLIILVLVGFCYFTQTLTFGQSCTINRTAAVSGTGWSRGSTVRVFIDTNNMSADAQRAVHDAFTNWQNANQSNGSLVNFEFTTTRPQSGVGNYVIVRTDTNITDPQTGGQVRAAATTTTDVNTGQSLNAGIRFDNVMTNYGAVLESMVHEIGHTFGFGHCNDCSIGESVMAGTPYTAGDTSTYNVAYGKPTSPTDCDNYKLNATNYPDCGANTVSYCTNNGGNWDGINCTCNYGGNYGGGGSGSGGEGSGGYYCTPYYWYYYESWDGGETWYLEDISYAGCW
jgi:hypothetical protein